MTFILIFACIITPYKVAFFDPDDNDKAYEVISILLDLIFCVDMIVFFNSAYYDSDFKIKDARCDIATYYFKSWFITDFLAIFPFSIFIGKPD